jgi:hypothetical protein
MNFVFRVGVLFSACGECQVNVLWWGPLSSHGHLEVEVNLRPTVNRPVCLGVRRPSGTFDQFFFLLEISFRQLRVCYFVTPSLTRGRDSLLLCPDSESMFRWW